MSFLQKKWKFFVNCNSSHRVHPSSTALRADPPCDKTFQPSSFASLKFQVLINTGLDEAIKSEKSCILQKILSAVKQQLYDPGGMSLVYIVSCCNNQRAKLPTQQTKSQKFRNSKLSHKVAVEAVLDLSASRYRYIHTLLTKKAKRYVKMVKTGFKSPVWLFLLNVKGEGREWYVYYVLVVLWYLEVTLFVYFRSVFTLKRRIPIYTMKVS